MKSTPIHDNYNADLLANIPADASRVVEVGCSSGALARAYLSINPSCEYIGIEGDAGYAEVAREVCTDVVSANIETLDDASYAKLFPAECWVFGDVLEHLYDPWAVLRRLSTKMRKTDCVIACIPNAQHWSVQARLNQGIFFYEDAGLMDRTHIRWFTRTTIIDLFESTGFDITAGGPRVFEEPARETALVGIRAMAEAIGIDPEIAATDASALQWIVRAVPKT